MSSRVKKKTNKSPVTGYPHISVIDIIFKDEKNSRLENLLRNNKKSISTFTSVNQDADLICKRIKFCIKTILKGLNLLNNKDYSYLNKATSTKKFFSAIKKL